MKMKKLISILLVGILTMSLFVGCAREELSYYKLYKEINTLMLSKPMHTEGTMTFNLDTLPQELLASGMDASETEVLNEVVEFINDNSITYSIDSDAMNHQTVAVIDLYSTSADKYTPLFTVLRDVDTTYVKVDDYIQFAGLMVTKFGGEEMNVEFMDEMNEVMRDTEYVSVSDEELITFYANMLGSSMGQEDVDMFMEQLREQLDPEMKKDQADMYYDIMDNLLEKVYSSYSMDIVEKEDNNKYSMTFDADNLGDTVIGFLDYSLDNSDELVDTLREFLLDLSDEEYSMLVGAYAMNMMNQKMLVDGLDSMSEDFAENKDEYKAQLEQGLLLYNNIYKAYIDGSELQITLGEEDDVYTQDISLKVQVNDIENEQVAFEATMTINETYEETEPIFQVGEPAEGVVTFTELLDQFPKTMEIYVDYDMYTMVNVSEAEFSDSGSINTLIVDDHSYLPTRMIAEKFGETIEWDNELKKPYIIKDGTNVYIDEFIIEDSVSYVKVREFEKFGYTISWDEDLRLITIEK